MKKESIQNRYEFLERKRAVDASWFILLPFLLIFTGILWHYQIAPIPFIALLKANLIFTGCYIVLYLFIERADLNIRYLRWVTLLSFFVILSQITVTIHFMGGYEAFLSYPLYLLPIAASGLLFSGWYPLGCALLSTGLLAILFILESPAFVWYLVNIGMPQGLAVIFEKLSINHYPVFGLEVGPEIIFTTLVLYLLLSLACAFLAQSIGPILDRLYRQTISMERDIKGRGELFNLSMMNAPTGFIIGYKRNYHPIHINKNIMDTFGLTEDETAKKDIFSLIAFESGPADFLKQKIDDTEPLETTLMPIRLKDGARAFFQIKLSFLEYPTPAGEEMLFLLIINNVTEELELSNIIMNSRDAMILVDLSGKIDFYNNAAGGALTDLLKGLPFEPVLAATRVFPPELRKDILDGKVADGKVRLKEKTFLFSSSPLKDVTGVELGILFSLKDVTNEEVFYNLSIKDELTQLYNRRYFFEMLEKEVAQAQRYPKPLTIAIMDIDFFKKVNDTYGHHAGDIALKTFAKTILIDQRKADVAARIGGEEFAFYMPFVDMAGASMFCEKVRERVANLKVEIEGVLIPVTCSIGVAEYTKGDDVTGLMAKADQGLYEAKRAGRNKVVIFSENLLAKGGN